MAENDTAAAPERPVEHFVMVQGEAVPASLEPDRTEFQAAYRLETIGRRRSITIDMPAAREIARAMVRTARAPAFAQNDAATMQALQAGAKMDAIRERGELLRNAPADKRIDDAADPDALLAAVDAIVADMLKS